MKVKKLIVFLCACEIALSGCADLKASKKYKADMLEASRMDSIADIWIKGLPDPSASYGAYPSNYVELVKGHLLKTLKDPESARYTGFTSPIKEHVILNISKQQALYGYSVCVLVNAKNSYGGYVGNHQYWFFIKNNQVVRSRDIDSDADGRVIYRGHNISCQSG